MASNGVILGNSDYSYLPLGWTCQSLVTSPGNINVGYDVKYPVHEPVKVEAPVEETPVAVPEAHEENAEAK